jgi:peptide/nickel transport system substrate-binding protein
MGVRPWALRALLAGIGLFIGLADPLWAKEAQGTGSVLRIAVSDLPATTFPIGARTAELGYLRGFTGRSLTIYDKSWAVAGALCTGLPTLENGGAWVVQRADDSKGIDVTFDLDPRLIWDDGVPVTTADVLFSVEVAHRLGAGAAALPNILDAVALDEHRVTLHISSVRFDYNRLEELFLLPAHREKAIFDAAASPADYRAHSLYMTDPTAPGLSYGPYRIAQASPDEIVLTRNSHWGGKRPDFDRIVLRKFSDVKALEADLAAQQIDMVAGESGLDIADVSRLEAEDTRSVYSFIYKPTLLYGHIDINLSNEVLADKRIRRALLLALDRPITGNPRETGVAEDVPRSFLPPDSPNFDPTVKAAPYDPDRGMALLDAAGFEPGPDGIRADSRGRRLAFRLAGELGWAATRRCLETAQAQWRKIGVEVRLEDRPLAEALSRRQFDLAYYTWSNSPEFLLEPVYGKSGIPTAENGYRGLNFPGFDDAGMNEVVAALTTEMNPARRLLLWRRAQQIYAEELPALPLSFGTREYIVPASMTGVEPTGHMIPTSYWVEDWKLN